MNTSGSPESPLEGSEHYEMNVTKGGVFIDADNKFALTRALATLTQLVIVNGPASY